MLKAWPRIIMCRRLRDEKPMSKRPIGSPKTRWEDDVLEDTKSIMYATGRKQCRIVVAHYKKKTEQLSVDI